MSRFLLSLTGFILTLFHPLSVFAAPIVGDIANPIPGNRYFQQPEGQGLFLFISNLFKAAAVIGGIFVIIQFFQAGFMYITAEGDAKKTAAAWQKIWQSVLGLVIIASSFILIGLVERFTGLQILNFNLYGP
jgi:hypothetical protein